MNDYRNTTHNVLALYRWAHGPATDATVHVDWMTRFNQEDARRFLRDGLMIRCNRGLAMQGRKFDPDYQIILRRSGDFLKAYTRQTPDRSGLQWALNPSNPFQCVDVAARLPYITEAWRERNS